MTIERGIKRILVVLSVLTLPGWLVTALRHAGPDAITGVKDVLSSWR